MRKLLTILMLLPLFAVAQMFERTTINLNNDNVWKQQAWIYRPDSSSIGKPVLIWFAGRGEAADINKIISISPVPRDINGFGWRPSFSVIAYTGNGSGVYTGTTNGGGDTAYFRRLFDYIKNVMKADMSRVYAGGLSGGGEAIFKVLTLGEPFSTSLAAIVPASPMQGAWELKMDTLTKYGSKINSWGAAGNGSGDISFLTRLQTASEKIKAGNGYARVDIVQGGNHDGNTWNPFFAPSSAIWPWMLTKRSNDTPLPPTELSRYEIIFMSDGSKVIQKVSGIDQTLQNICSGN